MNHISEGLDQKSVRYKIFPTIEELGDFARDHKAEGRKVVLCHGVFDLIHMGHVRHLEGARKEGDILLVTLTADQFVNKGPGRPVFKQDMRAEMLAAMTYVDGVAINPAPSSAGLLDIIQPDVYVKGSDYADMDKDITGKILEEKKAVEKHGGRLVFTDDITFSSSTLINRYLNIHDKELSEYLQRARERDFEEKIFTYLEKIKDMKVILVGDAIIDEYQFVSAMGKPSKENIIATQFRNKEIYAGGIFATANTVASFCKEVEILTCLGTMDSHEEFIRRNLKSNIKLTVVHRDDVPTTRKCRFVEDGYNRKLYEVYYFDGTPHSPELDEAFVGLIKEKVPDYDLVIANDFGHGLISNKAVDVLQSESKFLAVNTQTNSANVGFNLITRYQNPDYVCIDGPEGHLAVADRYCSIDEIIADKLPKRIDCQNIIITHGPHGCVTWDQDKGIKKIPAFTKTVVDTIGAGDAFLAVTSPLIAAQCPMEVAGFVGNAVGAITVGIIGHRESVERVPLVRFISTLLK